MSKLLFVLLILVGLINFLPVFGVLSTVRLESAYGIELNSSELIILMRHRALLFGIVGSFIIYSAFKPVYRTVAMVFAGLSMVGFVVLSYLVGDFNESINKIILADFVGISLLAAAVVIQIFMLVEDD
ncbi:hypothetical protein [Ferrimonas marina]|uniref:Phosphopantetheine adenylyltransferase n=1 Tax=Ferrimonas marina TaxID=299255 RepID=A0A1M5NNJ3_9GAMM|nr:hypothetical protein [Ferrimonas marina]SHG91131.1 hypothetical protein SAMN02745129_1125 [Ferrimonas marina]